MGERKVLNKYFPPDFDPSKLPPGKRPDHNSMKVRMMLPMSVRCNTCGNFMYKGTKFNCKKQDVEGETYLGLMIVRFYFRCAACAAEFILKTDPQNTDYIMERGATRNYEPWREKEKNVADAVAQREEEERGNAMKALENRTLDSKREMDIMGALDELQSMNQRHERVGAEAALAAIRRTEESQAALSQEALDAQDQEALKQFTLQRQKLTRRLDDSPPRHDRNGAAAAEDEAKLAQPQRTNFRIKHPAVKVVKKQKIAAPIEKTLAPVPEPAFIASRSTNGEASQIVGEEPSLLGLVGYGSSESD